jgi:hypothetical protein
VCAPQPRKQLASASSVAPTTDINCGERLLDYERRAHTVPGRDDVSASGRRCAKAGSAGRGLGAETTGPDRETLNGGRTTRARATGAAIGRDDFAGMVETSRELCTVRTP